MAHRNCLFIYMCVYDCLRVERARRFLLKKAFNGHSPAEQKTYELPSGIRMMFGNLAVLATRSGVYGFIDKPGVFSLATATSRLRPTDR